MDQKSRKEYRNRRRKHNERARRLNDPVFKAELMRSRNEFVTNVTNMGNEAATGAYQFFIEGVTLGAWTTLQSMVDKKTTFQEAVRVFFKGTGRGALHGGKAIFHALQTAGRGGLHTIRWILAK